MHRLALIVLPLALAACGHHAREETQTTVTKNGVTTTTVTTRDAGHDRTVSGLNIDTDDFKANVAIPGLSFAGDHMDMDGMKLYPGSTVKGMRVHAIDRDDHSKGEVTMDFTSPAAPVKVAQHFAEEARRAGFIVTANSASSVSGSKPDDDGTNTFTVTLNPNGDATVGQMTMSGIKTKS